MSTKTILIAILIAFYLASPATAKIYQIIDTFADRPPPMILVISVEQPNYYWYSPYFDDAPLFTYVNTPNALGGQRDSILGHVEPDTPTGSVAISSIVQGVQTVAFPLDFNGGAYYQWDGDDSNGGAAFPGVKLNSNPGITGVNGVGFDFTFGGRAIGIYMLIVADHEIAYYLDIVGTDGINSTLPFVAQISDPDPREYFFPYTDARWTNRNFDFSRVAGFEVRIFSGILGGDASDAIDTSFTNLWIYGYEISGRVIKECICNSGEVDDIFANEPMDLFSLPSNTLLKSTNTDASGNYIFTNLNQGTFNVCLRDTSSELCAPRCISVTINDVETEHTNIDFFKTQPSVLILPPNVRGDCSDCKLPSNTPGCPGFATAQGCSGNLVINTYTDITTGTTCELRISRTWTNPDDGTRGTQFLTYLDTTAPTFTTPPQSISQPCDASNPTTIQSWVATNAGAIGTDNCSTFTISNNYNGQSVGACSSVSVTFTITDLCGFSNSASATYSFTDTNAPTIAPGASSQTVECDLKTGSNSASLTTFLNNRGGAVAVDSCSGSSVTWSNNYVTGSFTPGCDESVVVIFTVSDSCNNRATTSATFASEDNTAPVITRQASNLSAQCTSGSAQGSFDSWRASHGGALATDGCITNDANLIWTDDFTGTIGGSGCSSAFPVIFTVTDLCGFSASTSATFSIVDNAGPRLVTPASNLVAQCGTDINSQYNSWLGTQGGASATDDCTSVVWSNNAPANPTSGCNSPVTVTFSATDLCNNTPVQTTATFTVRDSGNPSFSTNPTSTSVECTNDVTASFNAWLSSNAGATAQDDCSSVSITNDFPANGSPSLGCNAVTTVRFTPRDACANVGPTATATFTVTDLTPPTINTQAANQEEECGPNTSSAYSTWLSNRGGATATDTCSAVTWTNSGPATIANGCLQVNTVTFTARDQCLNTAVTTATFTVRDTTAPTIVPAARDLTTECSSGGNDSSLNSWLASRGGASATDNCGAITWTNDFVALTPTQTCTDSAVVTFTATDPCGFSARTTATYTQTDSQPPTINPPATSTTVQCDPSSNTSQFDLFIENHGGARATDNCVATEDLIWTASGSLAPQGCDTALIVFTVQDGCGGSRTTSASFTIVDTARPTFTTPPTSLSVECDGNGNTAQYANWRSTFGGAVATDVCAFSIVYSTNAPQNGPVGCGSVPATITATDECNNAAIATVSFTVVDTSAPQINVQAQDTSVQCTTTGNQADLTAFLNAHGNAQANDVCYGSALTWTNNFVSLSIINCQPTATVTFTVVDGCGQRATTTATYRVVDTLAPTITTAASVLELECNTSSNTASVSAYVTSRGGATATDNCSGVTWTNNFVNQPTPCGAPLAIIFTATDACGNAVSTTGTVQIIDTIAPDFVNFPADTVIGCDQEPDLNITGEPDAVDDCTTTINLDFNDVSFQQTGAGFCPGDIIITRTFTITDACGNSATRVQTIVQEIARSTGPCLPSECPPCENVACCDTVLEQVPCNPVRCNPVGCSAVACQAVPCIPQSCGETPDPTPNPQGPVPLPSVIPAPPCEPVYIYVFNDDGDNYSTQVPDIPQQSANSSSTVLTVSLVSLLVLLISLF